MKKMFVALLLALLLVLSGCGTAKNFIGNDETNASANATTISSEPVAETSDKKTPTEVPTETPTETLTEAHTYTCEIDTEKYFFNQLSAEEKEIYSSINENREFFINNKILCVYEGFMTEENELSSWRALHAYMNDNPISSIWLGCAQVEYDWEFNEDGSFSKKGFFIVPQGYESGDEVQFVKNPHEVYDMIAEVEKTTQEFIKTLNGTDAEKLVEIRNWLISDCEYSTEDPLTNWSVYGSIIKKSSCCAGDAYALKYVADMAGLNTLCVQGLGIEEDKTLEMVREELKAQGLSEDSNHMWNYVFTEEGGWTLVDNCWDRSYMIVSTDKYEDVYLPDGEYLGYLPVSETKIVPTDGWLFVDLEDEKALNSHIPAYFDYPT